MDHMERLGRQIKDMRKSRGWTQDQLGKRCGVERAQISKIENGILSKPELRLLTIAELFGCELNFTDTRQSQKIWLHPEREHAYRTTVCELLRTRNVQKIDLIQFSGFTAIPILQTVADYSPSAHIRLLLASPEIAALYGWLKSDGFHQRRISSTLDQCHIIIDDVRKKNQGARLTIEIWYYQDQYSEVDFEVDFKTLRNLDIDKAAPDNCYLPNAFSVVKKNGDDFLLDFPMTPSIAGIIADNWLVSVGWYRTFPSKESPTGVALAGHNLPAITVIEEQAQPLIAMVHDQFEALVANRRPSIALRIASQTPDEVEVKSAPLLF